MTWKVDGVMERRKQFLSEYLSGEWTMAELCRVYGISRPTGYAVVERFAREGEDGFRERSRAPRRHPNQVPAEIETRVLKLRRKYPRWGPRTLKKLLEDQDDTIDWPAASTIGEMLDREGLTRHRRKRRRTEPFQRPFQAVGEPNDEWAADFKGWMRTGDGGRIDPLTISDAYSRFLLRCQGVEKTDTERVKAVFEAAFREYGMPRAIRTDNGPPFASRTVAGLSRLAVWWIKLGILPERIQPGHPEQNGRHERMHRTLKEATGSPPEANWRAQQRAFDRFRREYNEVRPHQALQMKTPAAIYHNSPRPYPSRVPEPEYGSAVEVRRVQKHGQFHWKYQDVFLSKVLHGERIGLLPIDDRYYLVHLATTPIARFDTHSLLVERLWAEDRQHGKAGDGNVEIPKADSHIPTATTATRT